MTKNEDTIFIDLTECGWQLFASGEARREVAQQLDRLGYRKQDEVVREIFEEIDGITDLFAKGLIGELEMYDEIAKRKKKYTEGGGQP